MKKIKLLIITLLFIGNTIAQQLPNVSYFMYDQTRTNAGSIGSKDMICASILLKESMMRFVDEGAPSNLFASIGVPFNLFGAKQGVGLSFYRDVIGFYNDIDIKLGYAIRLNVADGTLGIGIDGSYRQKSLDATWNYGVNGDDLDPNIPKGSQDNLNGLGAGFGLFYRSEDIYLGASVTNIYSKKIEYNITETAGGASASETLVPHYYLTAGYNFQLSNPAYEIEPAVNFYTDGASTTFDLNAILTYNKRIWGGVSYRAGSAVVGMVGFMILDGVKVGAAYDYYTSALSQHAQGGFEVVLNYCFKVGVEKSPQRYRSIRYL